MKAGWMLALIMLIFTAVLTTWCMLLLLWAKDKLVADGKRGNEFLQHAVCNAGDHKHQ
jgi:amino acid permease